LRLVDRVNLSAHTTHDDVIAPSLCLRSTSS
jgi:hypothetical protein